MYQNQGGYPQGGYPQGGYPQGGYPQGGYPQAGYPGGQPGYPPPPQPGFQPPGAYGGAGFQPGYGDDGTAYLVPGYPGPGAPGLGEDGEVKGFDFTEASIRRSFIRKVYSILMCQLLVTMSFIALFLYHTPTKIWVQQRGMPIFWVAFIVMIVCLIAMACCEGVRRKPPTNFIFLGLFTLAESFLLGVSASMHEADAVMMAVGITAAICLALTLFAFQTKWDFTMMGGILLCGAVVLMLFGIVLIFIDKSKTTQLIYGSLGALLFAFYLVYDTQLMMGGKHKYSISPEEYIFAALNLYLDIVNMFMYILTIISASRD
ncbi:inhibitor of apoptosis-promoting bax1 domain-containing protein [Phthorimaea operculella]|nr:inhibitor of apoptosis-promoting bax1 domain-containing protein [Phthorimaea operculella]